MNITNEEYVNAAILTESSDFDAIIKRFSDPRIIRLLHSAIGLCTESGEFLDQLKRVLFYGKPLDTVNLIEEIGDQNWYQAIAIDELKTTIGHIQQININKLAARYGETFSELKALSRDLQAEREQIEKDLQ